MLDDKDKSKIQRQIQILKVEIYKSRLKQRRLERVYIEKSLYSPDGGDDLMDKLTMCEQTILRKQAQIDSLLDEIKVSE